MKFPGGMEEMSEADLDVFKNIINEVETLHQKGIYCCLNLWFPYYFAPCLALCYDL